MTASTFVREEIPQGVLDDIYDHYEEITFENYGKPVNENCKSRKSNYTQLVESNVTAVIMNSETFMPETVAGVDKFLGFVVRGEFTDNSADIYMVMPIGAVVMPHKKAENL